MQVAEAVFNQLVRGYLEIYTWDIKRKRSLFLPLIVRFSCWRIHLFSDVSDDLSDRTKGKCSVILLISLVKRFDSLRCAAVLSSGCLTLTSSSLSQSDSRTRLSVSSSWTPESPVETEGKWCWKEIRFSVWTSEIQTDWEAAYRLLQHFTVQVMWQKDNDSSGCLLYSWFAAF